MTARSPASSQGPPIWRVVVAFAVLGVLAVALVLVARSEPRSGERAASVPSIAVTEATAAPAIDTATAAGRLLDDTAVAMAAWGLFAATGDMEAVYDSFTPGPQLDQLLAEAPDRAGSGPGLPAFDFAMSEVDVISVEEQVAVVRTTIRVSRPATAPADFRWDVEMRWDAETGRWLLYTVTTVDD